MVKVTLERVQGDYGFEAKDASKHVVQFDSSAENGGQDFGVRPMQSLLMALGSCSAIDVVSILKKQRQTIAQFSISIEGEREEGATPSLWKNIQVHFILGGAIDADKGARACELSMQKYCSVAETLRRAGAAITWQVTVNNVLVTPMPVQ